MYAQKVAWDSDKMCASFMEKRQKFRTSKYVSVFPFSFSPSSVARQGSFDVFSFSFSRFFHFQLKKRRKERSSDDKFTFTVDDAFFRAISS